MVGLGQAAAAADDDDDGVAVVEYGVPGDPLPKYSPGAVYPETPYIQSTNTTILVRDSATSGLEDLTAGVLMGATIGNWGHGLGWSNGFGCGAGYYNQDHAEISINHHYENSISNAHHCYDNYGDLQFGDGGYNMDFSCDFGF
ncbi:UNVERIFIED_CONTAM: hypothetical protein PYX00_007202 [Menopon gallinae]|uniref:Uncharacterized protein n=1 Tax=Menopon gallinae TaxID=328185 RepID=A0AAW2HJ02_9NEOP